MDLVARVYLLLTGFIATGYSLPNEATTTLHPSVFEMETPPGFMRFLPLKDEAMAVPINFKSWHMHYNYGAPNTNSPDWFHFSDAKPEVVNQDNKNTEKGDSKEPQKTEDINKDWKQTLHEAFNLVDSPIVDTFDAKDVFPPYYNVFLSNAYPNWMAVPGFVNKITNHQEDKHEKDMKAEESKTIIKIDERIGDHPASIKTPKFVEKEETKINYQANEDDPSEVPQSDSLSLKIARNIDLKSHGKPYPIIFPDEINVKAVPEKIDEVKTPSTTIDKNLKSNADYETATTVNVMITDEVPVQVTETQDNLMSIPIMTIKPNIEDKNVRTSKPMLNLETPANQIEVPTIIPHYSEEKQATVIDISDAELQEKASSDDDSNPMKTNFLYNLLMKIKLSNIEDIGKEPSKTTSEIAELLVPVTELPTPKSTNILSGDNVVINNADDPPTVEQNENPKPSPDTQKSSNTGSLSNVFQNPNLPTKPNIQVNPQPITRPNTNQRNVPLNTFVPYNNGNNIQRPVLLTMPYNNNNNVPMNYMLTPMNVQPPNNGQMPLNQQAYPTNNMMLVSPGINSGNNMPLVNPGMNSGNNMPLVNLGMNSGNNMPLVNPRINSGNNMLIANPGMNSGNNMPLVNPGMNFGNNMPLANSGMGPGYNNIAPANGMNSGDNNMALVNPGINSGQNVYTIVPLANVGNVGNMNTGPSQYLNSNQSPNGYQMGSLPMYNLVPVNANVLVNTKDQEESM